MKPDRNRPFYPTSLIILLSLVVGNVVCWCHGVSQAWAQESLKGQSSTCHSHHDHHEDDAHPVDGPRDCDCGGICCSIFLTPQQTLTLNSSIVCHQACDFLGVRYFSHANLCLPSHTIASHWNLASHFSEPSLYIRNASLLI